MKIVTTLTAIKIKLQKIGWMYTLQHKLICLETFIYSVTLSTSTLLLFSISKKENLITSPS
jgi:hypothetical protein